MPDRSLVIASFKYGLDTRRESLASLPGTLQICNNAFVNSGGELEKRRAFVLLGTLPTGANGFKPQGFQDTDTGIMVFSDSVDPGGLPTNTVWQQLNYPKVPPPGSISLIFYSTSYNGKAFVLANFDNEDAVFAYYDSSLVSQITDGIVLNHAGSGTPETIIDLATDLAEIVNRISGWTADANVTAYQKSDAAGYHEFPLDGAVLIMSPVGVRFTPVIENNNSVAGLLGTNLIDQNYTGIPNTAANATFTFSGGTVGSGDTITITAPALADGSGTLAISGGAVIMSAGFQALATSVATAINNNTYTTGYSAIASGVKVTVYAPASFGAVTFNLTVVTTGTLTTAAGSDPLVNLKLSFTPGLSLVVGYIFAGGNYVITLPAHITVNVTANSGNVTFAWAECNADGSTPVSVPSGFTMANSTGPNNTFTAKDLSSIHVQPAHFVCTATDHGPIPQTGIGYITVIAGPYNQATG